MQLQNQPNNTDTSTIANDQGQAASPDHAQSLFNLRSGSSSIKHTAMSVRFADAGEHIAATAQ